MRAALAVVALPDFDRCQSDSSRVWQSITRAGDPGHDQRPRQGIWTIKVFYQGRSVLKSGTNQSSCANFGRVPDRGPDWPFRENPSTVRMGR